MEQEPVPEAESVSADMAVLEIDNSGGSPVIKVVSGSVLPGFIPVQTGDGAVAVVYVTAVPAAAETDSAASEATAGAAGG